VHLVIRLGLGVALVASLATTAGAQKPDVDATAPLLQKLDTIRRQGERPDGRAKPVTITEGDVNGYLQAAPPGDLPDGVVDPAISILGDGRITARAIVDLDAVRQEAKPASVLDPVTYLSGRVPVTATGVLTVNRGVGRFALESATAGGIAIPKLLLQYIVSYYSRTPDNPNGLSLDAPFLLPAHIREVTVERGRAIIMQ
jgi:hypothetical protein